MDKRFLVSGVAALLLGFAASGQGLQLNEYEVFEENGISVLVYSTRNVVQLVTIALAAEEITAALAK